MKIRCRTGAFRKYFASHAGDLLFNTCKTCILLCISVCLISLFILHGLLSYFVPKKNCYKISKVSEGVLENVELGLDDFA